MLRPNCTSDPANSGGFRPEKEKVLFSVFHTFPAIFRVPHGRFALATRQIPVDLRFPHFSGGFPGPLRPFWTSHPPFSGGFTILRFSALFRPPHGVIGLANRQIPVVLSQIKKKIKIRYRLAIFNKNNRQRAGARLVIGKNCGP